MAGETTQADGYTPVQFETPGRLLGVLDVTHEVSAGELELADVIEFGQVPEGAVYVDGYLACDDLDTDGTPALTFDVGDDDDPDGLLDGSNVGQAGGVARFNGALLVNKTKTDGPKTISVTVASAAEAGAAGTIRLVLMYYCPDH